MTFTLSQVAVVIVFYFKLCIQRTFCEVFNDHLRTINRYTARVMYDGTRFKGWQDLGPQKNSDIQTVQGILKAKLSQRADTQIFVTGASRTDAGVHARGQAIHFDSPKPIQDLQNFEFTMNLILPTDIRIFNVSVAPPYYGKKDKSKLEMWHATQAATGKHYSYTFCTNSFIDPLMRRYCTHMYKPMDIELFKVALSMFQGTHDFASFTNGVKKKRNLFEERGQEFSTVRRIDSIAVNEFLPGYYRIDFFIAAALYKMIRNIVWSCAYTAGGEMTLDRLKTMLYEPRLLCDNPRSLIKATPAPPEGLCLEHVYYENF